MMPTRQKTHTSIARILLLPLVLWGISLSIGLFSAPSAHAAVIHYGDTYTLEARTQIVDDFYFFGDTLTVAGTTTGDMHALASQVIILGAVGQDLGVAAGRVTVDGVVSGDARIAGGVVRIEGEIGEDLVVAGGNVEIGTDAVVRGDLLVFGDRVILEGRVEGAVRLYVRTVELLGHMEHDVTVTVRESLSVRGDAYVGGDLRYSAPGTVFISDTVNIVGETIATSDPESGQPSDPRLFWILLQLCVLVGGATFLVWVFPHHIARISTRAFSDTGWLTLKGFACLFGVPVIALVLFVTVVGMIPAGLLFLLYLVGMLLAFPLSVIFAGVILAHWLKKEDGVRPWWASVGAVALTLATLIPLVGWFIRFALFILAFGTLCSMLYEWVIGARRTQPVAMDSTSDTDGEDTLSDGDTKTSTPKK